MRLRTLAAAVALSLAAAVPLAGVASAQQADRDCVDFASQAAAQAAFDADPADGDWLDRDSDGMACEDNTVWSGTTTTMPSASMPSEEGSDDEDEQVAVRPEGGVETGDGSSSGAPEPAVLALGGLVVLGLGAATTRRVLAARRTR